MSNLYVTCWHAYNTEFRVSRLSIKPVFSDDADKRPLNVLSYRQNRFYGKVSPEPWSPPCAHPGWDACGRWISGMHGPVYPAAYIYSGMGVCTCMGACTCVGTWSLAFSWDSVSFLTWNLVRAPVPDLRKPVSDLSKRPYPISEAVSDLYIPYPISVKLANMELYRWATGQFWQNCPKYDMPDSQYWHAGYG